MLIDLRSDTVTTPTAGMRAAMAEAEVGDDVYGEDPTVNRLEKIAAELLRTEKALFCSSGTQGNLLALLGHCQRGDECIVGQQAHTYLYEGGGAAALASIHPQPLDFEVDGTLSLEKIAAAVKPDDVHFARTRLICLENTQDGRVLPLAYPDAVGRLAQDLRLALHLDGARIFNAAVKQELPVHRITQHFDSVSFCLSKGLGAPVGSLLCGNSDLINKARRWRKTLGGGMRQAGILAAAGLYALENNVERLTADHDHAMLLGTGLSGIDEVSVEASAIQTNMVFVQLGTTDATALQKFLRQKGILIKAARRTRLVTHLDVSEKDILSVVAAFKEFFSR
jgi:threonine aldolase